MSQIVNFRDLGIKPETKGLEGEKINIKKILNKEIVVNGFRIKKSNYPEKGNGNRLDLEIVYEGAKRVLFSGSVVLQEMIQKIPKSSFPFRTTIVEENQRLEFT